MNVAMTFFLLLFLVLNSGFAQDDESCPKPPKGAVEFSTDLSKKISLETKPDLCISSQSNSTPIRILDEEYYLCQNCTIIDLKERDKKYSESLVFACTKDPLAFYNETDLETFRNYFSLKKIPDKPHVLLMKSRNFSDDGILLFYEFATLEECRQSEMHARELIPILDKSPWCFDIKSMKFIESKN